MRLKPSFLFAGAQVVDALATNLGKRDCEPVQCAKDLLNTPKTAGNDLDKCVKGVSQDGFGLAADFQCLSSAARDAFGTIKSCDGCGVWGPCDTLDKSAGIPYERSCGNGIGAIDLVSKAKCAQLTSTAGPQGSDDRLWNGYSMHCTNHGR